MAAGAGEIDLAARGLDFGLQGFPMLDGVVDPGDETGRVKIDVGQGGKGGLQGEDVHLFIADAHLAAGHGHLGQADEGIDQQVLQGRNFGIFAADTLYGAAFAFGSLFTLITKHVFLLLMWLGLNLIDFS